MRPNRSRRGSSRTRGTAHLGPGPPSRTHTSSDRRVGASCATKASMSEPPQGGGRPKAETKREGRQVPSPARAGVALGPTALECAGNAKSPIL